MTFSLIARCARTRQFGIAVSSSSIAVPARCGGRAAYAPLMDDYIVRAVDPGSSPGYGVPGDPR